MVQTRLQTKVLMNNVKRQFVDDITIQLNKIENQKSQFKKVVESTKCNNYVAINLNKLIELNLLCEFKKFLHACWVKVNEFRQEIKQGRLQDIPDKYFDAFVKSVYEMEQKVIECFKRLNITQY
jgi:transcription antitermination factor NusG